jgi:hypothetical protein
MSAATRLKKDFHGLTFHRFAHVQTLLSRRQADMVEAPDDEDTYDATQVCANCEEVYDEDEMGFNDDGVCEDCQDAEEADRQMRDDYYFWAR